MRPEVGGRFEKDIVCTCEIGKPSIYTFLDDSNHILRYNYESSIMTKDSIIDMEAALVQDYIRLRAYAKSEYPANIYENIIFIDNYPSHELHRGGHIRFNLVISCLCKFCFLSR